MTETHALGIDTSHFVSQDHAVQLHAVIAMSFAGNIITGTPTSDTHNYVTILGVMLEKVKSSKPLELNQLITQVEKYMMTYVTNGTKPYIRSSGTSNKPNLLIRFKCMEHVKRALKIPNGKPPFRLEEPHLDSNQYQDVITFQEMTHPSTCILGPHFREIHDVKLHNFGPPHHPPDYRAK